MIPQLLGALLLVVLWAAPTFATQEDEADEGQEAAQLELASVCTDPDRGLHRFQVRHVNGPATDFTVRVVGSPDEESYHLEPEEELYFWVPAAKPGTTELTWPNGIVTASQGGESCEEPDAEPEPSEPEPSEPAPSPVDAPQVPTDDDPTEPEPEPEPSEEEPSEEPSEAPATPDPDPAPTPTPSTEPEPRASTPSRIAEEPSDQSPAVAEPHPTPGVASSGYACPRGWVSVDGNADGRISDDDRCEPVIAMTVRDGGADTGSERWPLVALGVTLVLLLVSLGAGPKLFRS